MALRRSSDNTMLREVVEREYSRDTAGLTEQLDDPDAGIRRRAARDLAEDPANAEVLGRRLQVEFDPSVRESLFTALSGHPGAPVVEVLLELLRAEDAGLRNGAIEALAAMPSMVGPRVAAMLRDPDSDVRIFTVNLLGDLRHAHVAQWLLQVLLYETEVNVVCAAIEVLAEVGSATEVPALRAAVERFPDDPFVGFAVDMAIDRIAAE
jgi:HEAT repeat protein